MALYTHTHSSVFILQLSHLTPNMAVYDSNQQQPTDDQIEFTLEHLFISTTGY